MLYECKALDCGGNPVGNSAGGAPKLTVDGKPVAGDLVPSAKPGSTVIVECEV